MSNNSVLVLLLLVVDRVQVKEVVDVVYMKYEKFALILYSVDHFYR